MSGRDELLPFLVPISGLLDGDGCEWDARDPLDLLSREARQALVDQLAEMDRAQVRARAGAHTYWLG